jgi:uncharacterized protein (UPF0264 family)
MGENKEDKKKINQRGGLNIIDIKREYAHGDLFFWIIKKIKASYINNTMTVMRTHK